MMTAISEQLDEAYYQDLQVKKYFSKLFSYHDLHSSITFIMKEKKGYGVHDKLESKTTGHDDKKTEIVNNNKTHAECHWPDDCRIMLVEDNPVNQVVALSVLKRFHLTADVANNGLEALELLKQSTHEKKFTLILMDCQMPEMDGYQTSEAIRSDKAGKLFYKIPIIAMTANAMDDDKEKCFKSGMDDYLTKPIDPILLEQKLNLWLQQPEKIRSVYSYNALETIETEETHPPKDEPLAIWDEKECLKRLSGNKELLIKLLEIFLDDSSQTLLKISTTIASIKEIHGRDNHNDIDIALDQESIKTLCTKLLELVHIIKGLTGNLSANQFHRLATQLEADAENEALESIISSEKTFTNAYESLIEVFRKQFQS